MDPRPYHFEYRRPRLSNPTFESTHLYESIYNLRHLPLLRNPQSAPTPVQPASSRMSSQGLSSRKSSQMDAAISRYNSRSEGGMGMGGKEEERSRVASFGVSLMRNGSMDQREVYRRQENKFNIINYYPKDYEPALKQFPRLTLQDRLIERRQDSPSSNIP